MTTPPRPAPLPLQAPPEPDPAWSPLLTEPFAQAWQAPAPAGSTLRERLLARARASRAAEAGMVTVRHRHQHWQPLADGVQAQWLYRAEAGGAMRPGEPLQARMIEMAPGARLTAANLGRPQQLLACDREWLVLAGEVQRAGQPALTLRDYQRTPLGLATPDWQAGPAGARLFLRESIGPLEPALLGATGPREALTVRDAEAGWPAFAPGIRRRVLWHQDGQAALLYHAEAGAAVPQHRHGHDEECLMVQGELFLDDLLLQAGDYQLAPAGTGHRITQTDTGVVIYAHGDLDLQFTPGG